MTASEKLTGIPERPKYPERNWAEFIFLQTEDEPFCCCLSDLKPFVESGLPLFGVVLLCLSSDLVFHHSVSVADRPALPWVLQPVDDLPLCIFHSCGSEFVFWFLIFFFMIKLCKNQKIFFWALSLSGECELINQGSHKIYLSNVFCHPGPLASQSAPLKWEKSIVSFTKRGA